MRRLLLRLLSAFRPGRAEDDLARELTSHLGVVEDEYRRQGLSAADARLAARRAMNGIEQTKDRHRDTRSVRWIDDFVRDIRHALRMMQRDRAWTAVVVLSLALGIGANTAIFGAVNGLLVTKLHVADPDSLVRLRSAGPNQMRTSSSDYGYSAPDALGRNVRATFSYPMFLQFSQANRTMRDLIAGAPLFRLTVVVNGEAAVAEGFSASGNFFQVLGVPPVLGRTLLPDDDRADAAPVAVLSHAYWQSRFGGDPDVVDRTVRLNDVLATIVGVLPPWFTGIQGSASTAPDVTVAVAMIDALAAGPDRLAMPTYWWLQVLGRLQPGVTAGQVQGNLGGVFQATARAGLDEYLAGLTDEERNRAFNRDRTDVPDLIVDSGSRGVYDVETAALVGAAMLGTVVALVLLLVCANVANLLLSRSAARQRELAMRQSLGASRGRLARQLLAESLLLAAVGGALGVVIGYWGHFLLPGAPGQLFVFDGHLLAFVAVLTVAAGLAFGLLPALRGSRSLDAELKGMGRAVSARGRLANGLLVAQVAISLMLLVGAGLFLRTVQNLRAVDVGFNPDSVVLFRVDPVLASEGRLDDASRDQAIGLFASIAEQIAALPGVRSVGFSNVALLSGFTNTSALYHDGGDAESGKEVHRIVASPAFFETLQLPIVAGRPLTERDDERSPKVALVNQAAVREHFSGQNPIGLRFGTSPEQRGTIEVVGVVADAKYTSIRDAPPPTIYLPYRQAAMPRAFFEVRTAVDPLSLVGAIRDAVRRVDPSLPVTDVLTQRAAIEARFQQERLFASVSSLFGALAALVAAIGLFGLMSYSVARRTNEIGIRMTLGARPASVLRLILGESLVLVGIGIGIGLIAAAAAGRLVASQLYGLAPTDLVSVAGASALMLLVSAIAGYLPARRASKVDPMTALRCE